MVVGSFATGQAGCVLESMLFAAPMPRVVYAAATGYVTNVTRTSLPDPRAAVGSFATRARA
jgi:hypothetical protein